MRQTSLLLILLASVAADSAWAEDASVTFAQVHAVFAKHCLTCHDAKEAEGGFVMETYASLMKGGDDGPAIVPGKASESALVTSIEQTKKPFMPPPKKGPKLAASDIALIRAWIDAGAKEGPIDSVASTKPASLPHIEPNAAQAQRQPANAIAYEPKAKLFAVAGYKRVELRSVETRAVVRVIEGLSGNVNDVAFNADGSALAIASGQPGVKGEVRLVKTADGATFRTLTGHADAVYCLALSPDGQTLATGSYDQKVKLWDVAGGTERRTLDGHNGAIFDIAFRPDGKTLASASADRTVKLWDVATGERLDTLSEATKEQYAVAWTPDGSRVLAAGADNRIRVWTVSPTAKEGTNKIVFSQFGHEGTILRLALSADGSLVASSSDDRSVKVWDGATLVPKAVLPEQADWPTALAFAEKAIIVGRLDGGVTFYSPGDGKVIEPPPPPRPELSAVSPRGVQRGATTTLTLSGKNLTAMTAAMASSPKLHVTIKPDAAAEAATVEIATDADTQPGPVDLWVKGAGGESGRVRIWVDTVPQLTEGTSEDATPLPLPASAWGTFEKPGDVDTFAFDAKAGEAVVLDVAAQQFGSKADAVLSVAEPGGRVLATANDTDGSLDPLMLFRPPADGRYVAKLSELKAQGSPEHFYRLSVGHFAVVTGAFPLSVPPNAETQVKLLGYNLPADALAKVKAGAVGEVVVPIDATLYRARRDVKLLVSETPAVAESEPNDEPAQATSLPAVPGFGHGILTPHADGSPDVDLFRFDAGRGQELIVETLAAQRGSPVDTRIEILHADGRPVDRVVLRAVRDSWITFRAAEANAGGARLWKYDEMQLNQYLYFGGEVVRLFLEPRGPDSEYGFYPAADGRRRAYFDTTSVAHALDEPCYIIEPHAPGESLPPNGLPTFKLTYANDDDADRRLGTDSLVHFTAPADGSYLVRVTDSRGAGSDRAAYRLSVRPAKHDFDVAVEGLNPAIFAGAGRSFTVKASRVDGFEGPIRVEISDVPAGFTVSSPIVIEAGHLSAEGTVFAAPDAKAQPADAKPVTVTAKAMLNGQETTKPVGGFGKLSVIAKPKVLVELTPTKDAPASTMPEITVVPGQMVSAWLKITRNDFGGSVSFDVDNLPHGIIVADIGLNGVLIPEGQSERQVFLQCASWVAETDRLCYAKAREADSPTSRPVMVHVRRK